MVIEAEDLTLRRTTRRRRRRKQGGDLCRQASDAHFFVYTLDFAVNKRNRTNISMATLGKLQCLCCVLVGAILAVWMAGPDQGCPAAAVLDSSGHIVIAPPGTSSYYGTNQVIQTRDSYAAADGNTDSAEDDDGIDYDEDSIDHNDSFTLASNRTTPAINYLRQPAAFVQLFQECSIDPECHIMYHHTSKTGGTTLEHALFPAFNQPVELTCCHKRLRTRFFDDPEHFCSQKFTSWQMFDNEFFEVVTHCHQRDPQRRSLLLTSFREPTQTLVSYIHQMCNKNLHKRSANIVKACKACVFEKETRVWYMFAKVVSRQIAGSYKVSQLDSADYDLPFDRIKVATVETNDIDAFLWHWRPETVYGVANPELAGKCSFRPTTELLRTLRPALATYRLLLSGL
jgi:hypothetical protein